MKRLSTLFLYIIAGIQCFAQITPTVSKNYVIVQTPRVATSNESDLSDYTKATTVIQYSDGLGRGLQTIHYKASPNGQDIVSGVNTLDNFSRPIKAYLTTPTSQNTGAYTSTAETQAQTFYNDTAPYQETRYNPTNVRSVVAGSVMQSSGRYIESKGIVTGQGMRRYVVMSDQTTVTQSTFSSHVLLKNITTDENNNQIAEYTDREGRKIQQDQINSQNGQVLSTAYVYDDTGRLRYIIPPKAFAIGGNFDESGSYFSDGIYAFRYDGKGRVVERYKPNGGWSYVVYNELDQVVMSQDARQRESNLWEWVRYDGHGRKVMTGTFISANSRATFQSSFDSFSEEKQFEERGSSLYGYTARSSPFSVSSNDVKAVYYYDDYTWVADANFNFQSYKTAQYTNVKGLPTGSLVRKLDDNSLLKSVIYYDENNRPIQTIAQNRFGGYNQSDVVYNFIGQTTEERTLYRKPSQTTIESKTTYQYDHVGRKKGAVHFLNGKPTPLANYKHDEAGRLIQKRLMQTSDDIIVRQELQPNGRQDIANRYVLLNSGTITPENGTYLACISPNVLQVIDYSYNIQGQLRNLNAHADGGASLFNLTLDYFETGQYYNGNLAKQTWQTTAGSRSFNYYYDGFDRTVSGVYNGVGSENYTTSDINYDSNGNITSLLRNGYNGSGWGQTDNLNYTYQNSSIGNRLQGVQDYSGQSKGFTDNGSNNNYTYYNDGSLKSDANKNISNVSYNYLGLPDLISFGYSGTQYIQNIYDAEGQKLRQRLVNGSSIITTDYMGGLIYRNDSLKTILHDEGRIYLATSDINNLRYQFFIPDHLGNTRIIIERQSATTAIFQTTDYGVWGEILENVTGATTGDWKTMLYQGKEWIDFNGTKLYDFGTRLNDPMLGRMWQLDGANQFASGYIGMGNNPVSYIDPDGQFAFVPILIGAAIVGGINLAGEAIKGNVNNFKQGALAFGMGAISGALAVATGGSSLTYTQLALQAAVSQIPAFNVSLGGGFSLSLSPSLMMGTQGLSLGANVGLGYTNGNFSVGISSGIAYGSSNITGVKGWNARLGGGISFDNGKFYGSLSTMKYWSGETSQRTGTIGIGGGDVKFHYENDFQVGGLTTKLHVSDGGDRFRTAAGRLSYKDFSVGFNLFTGDPNLKNRSGDDIDGHLTYTSGSPDKYRLGGVYVGYKNIKVGANSEWWRHQIQNRFAHSFLHGSPYWFKVLNHSPATLYGNIGTFNPFSLW